MKNLIRLTVKGSPDILKAKAASLDIPIMAPLSIIDSSLSTAFTTTDHEDKVVRWFCDAEDNRSIIPGYGFQDGTLLLYTFNC